MSLMLLLKQWRLEQIKKTAPYDIYIKFSTSQFDSLLEGPHESDFIFEVYNSVVEWIGVWRIKGISKTSVGIMFSWRHYLRVLTQRRDEENGGWQSTTFKRLPYYQIVPKQKLQERFVKTSRCRQRAKDKHQAVLKCVQANFNDGENMTKEVVFTVEVGQPFACLNAVCKLGSPYIL